MAVATGQRTTATVAASQGVIDLQKEILLLEPSEAPLTVISQRTKKGTLRERCSDVQFSWHNDEAEQRFDAVNNGAGYNSSATSIVVDTGTVFADGDIVLIPRTGEQVRVSGVSTNTLTVERGWGATTGAAIVDNDPVLVIGTAQVEGATAPEARSENPVKVDNYTQIYRESVKASGSWLSSSNMSSPHDWPYQHKKKAIEHLKEIEYGGLFGTPSSGTQRTTGGLLNFLTYNGQDMGGTMSETELETWLRTLSRYGSGTITTFASALAISVIDNFAIGRLHTHPGDTSYGLNVMEYISAHGTLQLVKHKLLEGAVYGGYMIGVDMKSDNTMKYRFLNGDGPGPSRDTKLLTNRQTNDTDGQMDEWLTEQGWQVGRPKTGGVATGITG